MENKLKELITKIAILNELSIAGADPEAYLDELMVSIENDEILSPILLKAQEEMEG
ncbi:hypothetical protein VP424E501_P0105 [Vibrio phage 424E50-1]|nr:hypothetical protein VP424E501_P0105 [Vibrio phage 424E50-1]